MSICNSIIKALHYSFRCFIDNHRDTIHQSVSVQYEVSALPVSLPYFSTVTPPTPLYAAVTYCVTVMSARFSAPVETGPGAHPAAYTMGTVSFPGLKRPGRGVDHPPHLAHSSPFGPSWPLLGRTLPLLLPLIYGIGSLQNARNYVSQSS